MIQKFVQSKRFPFWPYWRMFNYWPAIRGSGARVKYVARDWTEMRVTLTLGWRTRNYVGTIFGGSIYAAADPWFMVMILRQIGDDYVVWDKSARVTFKRPGTETLYAVFEVPAAEVADLQARADEENQLERTYSIDLKNKDGKVFATVDKVIYVARKDWFKERQARRAERSSS
jgi:acyl-coenzyme A thioesterase PaaI-like protein